jgi:hypothetical protein
MPLPSSTPRHPASSSPIRLMASGFPPLDWRLLVALPAEIMIAAISAQDGGPRRTVPEGLAGLDAIAAGRSSDSDLVRAVVAAIFAEPEEDRSPGSAQPTEPDRQRLRVLEDCRRAVEILRAGADPADAAAYRHWVQQVAVRVCGASRSGGVLGIGKEQLSAPERAFLDELGAVLS